MEAQSEAETARDGEMAARFAADEARGEAEAAHDGEKAARAEAEREREKLAVFEYGRTMELAHQEWRDNNIAAALALLSSTRPDLRGWEWHYVHRLCHANILTLKGHTGPVLSASFSPDGSRVVTTSTDGTARVWDAKTGAELLTLKGHTGGVISAAFSPDGTRVVTTASIDRTARVWDAKTGAELLALKGHTTGVHSAEFSPDGARVVTSSGDARVWDATPLDRKFLPREIVPPPPKERGPGSKPSSLPAPKAPSKSPLATTEDLQARRARVAALERALAQRPADPATRFELAQASGALAKSLFSRLATAKEGEETYRKAIALFEELCRDRPAEHRYHCWLGAARNNLAVRINAPARIDEKRKLLEQVVVAQLQALKLEPGNALSQQFLATNYSNLAFTLLKMDDHASVCATAQKLRAVPAPAGANAMRAAQLLADCWAKAGADKALTPARRKEVSEQYAAEVLASLRQAAKEGSNISGDAYKKHAALARLLTRPEFQDFLKEAEK